MEPLCLLAAATLAILPVGGCATAKREPWVLTPGMSSSVPGLPAVMHHFELVTTRKELKPRKM